MRQLYETLPGEPYLIRVRL